MLLHIVMFSTLYTYHTLYVHVHTLYFSPHSAYGVSCYAVHPGFIKTNIVTASSMSFMMRLGHSLIKPFAKNVQQGVQVNKFLMYMYMCIYTFFQHCSGTWPFMCSTDPSEMLHRPSSPGRDRLLLYVNYVINRNWADCSQSSQWEALHWIRDVSGIASRRRRVGRRGATRAQRDCGRFVASWRSSPQRKLTNRSSRSKAQAPDPTATRAGSALHPPHSVPQSSCRVLINFNSFKT